MQATTSVAATKRPRGRPPATQDGGDAIREQLIDAATAAYAEHGYHQTTVKHILAKAGISRPTFYRHFKDANDVIDTVVTRANAALAKQVSESLLGLDKADDMLKRGVQAYFQWCSQIGPVVGRIYGEINDQSSPASIHRDRIIEAFISLLAEQAKRLGAPPEDPLIYDALLRAVEHLGSTAFWPVRLSDDDIERHRLAAEKIMLNHIQPNN